jgi:hypothetical protein
MPAVHDPASPHPGPAPITRPGRNRGVIAGALLFLACAAACSLPVLLAGGVALSAGAFFTAGEGIALTVLAANAVAGGLLWMRRRRSQARSSDCRCGGGCGC